MKPTTFLALALSAAVSAEFTTTTSSLTPIYPTEQPTDTVITITQGSTTYTVPVWNPSTTYGPPGTTLPTDGPNQPSQSSSPSKSTSSAPASTPSPSSSTTTTSSAPSSTSSAPPTEQTTAAAYAMRPDLVGALAGGLAAGWALV